MYTKEGIKLLERFLNIFRRKKPVEEVQQVEDVLTDIEKVDEALEEKEYIYDDRFDEEIPSYEEQTELAPTLVDDLPDITFIDWHVPPEVFTTAFSPDVDYSLGALLYLQALGYKECLWHLSENHPVLDICDNLYGRTLSIDFLISNARDHSATKGYNPPSPIFALSHPKCICYLTCYPPSSIYEIPNDAPGLPIHGTDQELLPYKEKLFNNLQTMHIDHITFPPLDAHKESRQLVHNRIKVAKNSIWEENIKPVKVNEDFIAKLPLNFFRPIFKGYTGFILMSSIEEDEIYFIDLNRTINISKNFKDQITSISLEPNVDAELTPGTFVNINDEIGIVYRILGSDVLCYIPGFRNIVKVEEYIPLSIIED